MGRRSDQVGQGRRGERPYEVLRVTRQADRCVLDAGVVADEQHRLGGFADATQASEHHGGGGVELVLDEHLRLCGKAEQAESLAGSSRRGAQDEVGLDPFLPQVQAQPCRGTMPPRRQGPIVIVEVRVAPTRLGVTEESEVLRRHGNRTLPRLWRSTLCACDLAGPTCRSGTMLAISCST
jgi:hypothetical protein